MSKYSYRILIGLTLADTGFDIFVNFDDVSRFFTNVEGKTVIRYCGDAESITRVNESVREIISRIKQIRDEHLTETAA